MPTQGPKTKMMGLPVNRKSFNIGLAVQTQYRRVTDRQTDRHATTAMNAFTHSVAMVIIAECITRLLRRASYTINAINNNTDITE